MTNPGADPLKRPAGSGNGRNERGAAPESAEPLTGRIKERAADLKRQAESTVHDVGARARRSALAVWHARSVWPRTICAIRANP
jgi:hypothetical protein